MDGTAHPWQTKPSSRANWWFLGEAEVGQGSPHLAEVNRATHPLPPVHIQQDTDNNRQPEDDIRVREMEKNTESANIMILKLMLKLQYDIQTYVILIVMNLNKPLLTYAIVQKNGVGKIS